MKLFNEILKHTNTLKNKIFKTKNIEKILKKNYPYSDDLQKRLALLISDIETIDKEDLKKFEYKKIQKETGRDLFISYRLDFHSRDELNFFKKKYDSLIL